LPCIVKNSGIAAIDVAAIQWFIEEIGTLCGSSAFRSAMIMEAGAGRIVVDELAKT